MKKHLFLLFTFVFCLSAVQAKRIYVKPDGTGNGASWETAANLATALTNSVAANDDEVYVMAGEYKVPETAVGSTSPVGGFGSSRTLKVYGSLTGSADEEAIELGTPPYVVPDTAANKTVLIRSDAANGERVLSVGASEWTGFYITGATKGDNGAAVHIQTGKLSYSIIYGNTQTAGNRSGMIWIQGAGTLANCQVYDNVSNGQGGGVFCNNAGGKIINSIIRDNQATTGGGGVDLQAGAFIINSLIINNQATSGNGGGIAVGNGGGTVLNCTVVGNTASGNGGGINNGSNGEAWKVINTIAWDNSATNDNDIRSGNAFSSLFSGAPAVNAYGNVNTDPLFITGSYTLSLGSPAVDAGDDDAYPADYPAVDLAGNTRIIGERIDMGAYETVFYTVTLPVVEGILLTPETAANPVVKGDDFEFVLTLLADYNESTPVVSINRGGDDEILTGVEGAYTITEVTSDVTVSITGVEKNPSYTVTLPQDIAGLTITTSQATEVVSGKNFAFRLVIDAEYSESVPVVQALREGAAEAETITPDAFGLYSIKNIRANVTVTVTGVERNPVYTVTLPQDIAGLTIDTSQSTEVLSGTNFSFRLVLDAAYNQSAPVVQALREGVDEPETIAPDVYGLYSIRNIHANVTVTITGIVENPTVGISTLAPDAKPATATVYTLSGALYNRQTVSGISEIRLPAGTYIVQWNGQSQKVIIK
ncbi:MAG: T9SS type A sorting domain-containing protein [Candidatus Symbiothrix sp.]|jgi:hypothetical protein|nr:T9SS type A sorting domain-containing protein [Candidatus Symbiothrix sp.]